MDAMEGELEVQTLKVCSWRAAGGRGLSLDASALQIPPSTELQDSFMTSQNSLSFALAFPVPQLPSVIYPKAMKFLLLKLFYNRRPSASDSTQATMKLLRWNRSKTSLHFTLQMLAYTLKQNVITVRRMQRKRSIQKRITTV